MRAAIPTALFTLALLCGSPATGQNLKSEFAKKEQALLRLSSEAEQRHRSRCGSLATGSCDEKCSIPACGNTFSPSAGFQCTKDFGIDPSMCGSSCTGMWRSLNSTVVRFPPGVDFNDGDTQAFTCSTKTMVKDFAKELQSGILQAWSYVGHASGSIRIYPGAAQERSASKCSGYDARLRPWYISGSSGPKDVVIVYDVSGSMSTRLTPGVTMTRHQATVAAIVALLGTLTQNDRVAVVQFTSDASVVGASGMQRATPAVVSSLQSAVKRTAPGGGTSFLPALRTAFDVFSRADAGTRNCNSVMLFLTDGQTSEPAASITSLIRNSMAQLGRHVTIFSYSMSSAADNSRPRAMACASKGVWDRITDGEDPLTKMRGYFQFLAAGLDTDVPRWSSVYTDAFGLGEMVTVARPVYDRSGGVASLVGVVGADVTMAELSKYGDSASTILAQAYERSSTCTAFNLSTCQMQYLRYQASSYVCPNETSIATCDAHNEIVRANSCASISGGLNSMMCESLSSARIARGGAVSTAQTSCCPCLSGGGSRSSSAAGSPGLAMALGGCAAASLLALTP